MKYLILIPIAFALFFASQAHAAATVTYNTSTTCSFVPNCTATVQSPGFSQGDGILIIGWTGGNSTDTFTATDTVGNTYHFRTYSTESGSSISFMVGDASATTALPAGDDITITPANGSGVGYGFNIFDLSDFNPSTPFDFLNATTTAYNKNWKFTSASSTTDDNDYVIALAAEPAITFGTGLTFVSSSTIRSRSLSVGYRIATSSAIQNVTGTLPSSDGNYFGILAYRQAPAPLPSSPTNPYCDVVAMNW